MKKLSVLMSMFLFMFFLNVSAQDYNNQNSQQQSESQNESFAQKYANDLKTRINLDDDQTEEVAEILKEYRQDIAEARMENSGTDGNMGVERNHGNMESESTRGNHLETESNQNTEADRLEIERDNSAETDRTATDDMTDNDRAGTNGTFENDRDAVSDMTMNDNNTLSEIDKETNSELEDVLEEEQKSQWLSVKDDWWRQVKSEVYNLNNSMDNENMMQGTNGVDTQSDINSQNKTKTDENEGTK